MFFDIDAIADHSTSLPHMLPDAAQFAADVGKLGIGNDDTIVVYDGAGLGGAPRVWWTFRVFGARNVFVLDGGMPKWTAEGRRVESGESKREPRSFAATLNRSAVAGMHDVAGVLSDKSAQVVDARPAERFRGEAVEPRPGVRPGHMPGAFNVPVTELIENGRLVSPAKIAERFKAAGVDLDRPIVTSCGSGVTAATLWFALDAIGKTPQGALRRLLDRMGRGRRDAGRAEVEAVSDGTLFMPPGSEPVITGHCRRRHDAENDRRGGVVPRTFLLWRADLYSLLRSRQSRFPIVRGSMIFRQLFDSVSGTYTYLLASRRGGEALIIDPVIEKVDRYLQLVNELDLKLVKAVDTHLHADHITGLGALRDRTHCITVMGEQTKADVVSMRLAEGDKLTVEGVALDVLYTPGHTDDSYSFVMRDRVFTGDTLLIRGTGRTDFQNGDPRAQYDSIFNKLLKLPDDTHGVPGA